jgi:hypothetical protein
MTEILHWVRQAFIALGVTMLLLVGLLLAVLLARPLMIVGLAAAFAIVLASVFSPRVCAWLDAPG